MKRICFLLGSFQVGGGENHVLQVLKSLDREKYHPYICVLKDKGGLKEDFEKLNIPINVYSFWRRNFVTSLFNQLRFARFLKVNKIDIIHIHLVGCFKFGVVGAKMARLKSIIITWHGIYDPKRVLKKAQHVRYASTMANKIIAVSNSVKDVNCNLYSIDPSKVEVVYNGINTDIPSHKPLEKNMNFTIGCVGNLRKEKGYEYLLHSVKLLLVKIPGLKVKIVGDGPLQTDLMNLANSLNISKNIEFLGRRTDIYPLLASFDIWVMSSIFEGFSVALLEAMLLGLPIIATDVGGNAEAIEDGVSGKVIPPRDINALEEAIYSLFSNPEIRAKYSENAINRVSKNFSDKLMMEGIVRVYNTT
jgi:L-malate glycosyltransferase